MTHGSFWGGQGRRTAKALTLLISLAGACGQAPEPLRWPFVDLGFDHAAKVTWVRSQWTESGTFSVFARVADALYTFRVPPGGGAWRPFLGIEVISGLLVRDVPFSRITQQNGVWCLSGVSNTCEPLLEGDNLAAGATWALDSIVNAQTGLTYLSFLGAGGEVTVVAADATHIVARRSWRGEAGADAPLALTLDEARLYLAIGPNVLALEPVTLANDDRWRWHPEDPTPISVLAPMREGFLFVAHKHSQFIATKSGRIARTLSPIGMTVYAETQGNGDLLVMSKHQEVSGKDASKALAEALLDPHAGVAVGGPCLLIQMLRYTEGSYAMPTALFDERATCADWRLVRSARGRAWFWVSR